MQKGLKNLVFYDENKRVIGAVREKPNNNYMNKVIDVVPQKTLIKVKKSQKMWFFLCF